MDFPNFFDAMFELADMWAEGELGGRVGGWELTGGTGTEGVLGAGYGGWCAGLEGQGASGGGTMVTGCGRVMRARHMTGLNLARCVPSSFPDSPYLDLTGTDVREYVELLLVGACGLGVEREGGGDIVVGTHYGSLKGRADVDEAYKPHITSPRQARSCFCRIVAIPALPLQTTLHDVQKMDAADGTFSRLLKKFGYKSAFRPARESLFPPEPPPPPPPPPLEPKRAPSPQSEPSRPARTIPQHSPIRTDHVTSRVASHIRSFRSFREPRSQQGSGNWEGWDAAAGAAADADEGGENAQAGAQQQHPDAHMFSYGGGNHGGGCGPLPGSPPPDYGGVGGSGYGAAGAGGRWSPQRRGPFVMPAPAKVDYSGELVEGQLCGCMLACSHYTGRGLSVRCCERF